MKPPVKRNDNELYALLDKKLSTGQYIFSNHAKLRKTERMVSDLEILRILKGERGNKRKRNQNKDKYENANDDWNYCIEGLTLDKERVRIIFSFKAEFLFIITVIKVGLKNEKEDC